MTQATLVLTAAVGEVVRFVLLHPRAAGEHPLRIDFPAVRALMLPVGSL